MPVRRVGTSRVIANPWFILAAYQSRESSLRWYASRESSSRSSAAICASARADTVRGGSCRDCGAAGTICWARVDVPPKFRKAISSAADSEN